MTLYIYWMDNEYHGHHTSRQMDADEIVSAAAAEAKRLSEMAAAGQIKDFQIETRH